MLTYDAIVIGFGKGGKTLAGELSGRDWQVAVIEQDPEMYGGTCINIACIPTKTLAHDGENGVPYEEAVERKDRVVETLREKNYKSLAGLDNVTIFDAKAAFQSDKEVVIDKNGEREVITAEHIFINTGATNNIPPIKGDIDADNVYTSTSLINRKERPERLAIIGGGYIGLEYASMYQNFGSSVSVITPEEELMPGEDREIAKEVQQVLTDKGVNFHFGSKAVEITETDGSEMIVTLSNHQHVTADAVLLATGRKANTDQLGLDATRIMRRKDGSLKVDEHLETTAANVWALGDVRGDMQFTYTSLDDYRIIMNRLFGDKSYTLSSRKNIPYSIFIDPPLSRVGLTAKEAEEAGYRIGEGKLPVKAHPRAHVVDDFRGLFKAVIDKDTNNVLGVSLFGPESPELINLVKLAMDMEVHFDVLRDQVYNHPVMSESFNALFAID